MIIDKAQIKKNVAWNLFGTGIPLLIALYAIPRIIFILGKEQFGLLALVWVIVGYFTLFDFGIARALIKETAKLLGSKEHRGIPPVVWTSLTIMTGVGVLSSIILLLITPFFVSEVIQVPKELLEEMKKVVYITALSIPLAMNTSALRGVIEAHQRFAFIAVMKLIMGFFVFLSPLIVLKYTDSLFTVVLYLIVGRLFVFILYCIYCARLIVGIKNYTFCKKAAKYLLSYGGWIMVSSVVGPILLYLDRFMIASLVSPTAVTYYVTPYEVASKLLIVPAALMAVLFPVFSQPFSTHKKDIRWTYYSGAVFLFVLIFPITLIFCFYAKEILELWLRGGLGADAIEFAENSYRIAQLLFIGILVNSFGHLSQSLVQGYGRPDLTAKLHLVELILFVAYLWLLVSSFGAYGAAVAWLIRVSISTAVLSIMASMCFSKKIKVRYS